MSRNQRILLVVAAVAVAVIAFAIASPGSEDDEPGEQAAQTTTSEAPAEAQTEAEAVTETETAPAAPPEPAVTRIRIRDGQVVGGSKTIETARGEEVRIVVTSDAGDELHLHGYDITKRSGPGETAVFDFKANLEGVFELESHVAEDAGQDPLVAKLVVNPS